MSNSYSDIGNTQFDIAIDSLADESEQQQTPNDSRFDNNQSNNWLSLLPKILRGAGALAVIISLYTFLAKGWDSSGDLTRFIVFLGHTVTLAGIGLFNAKVIKESKGARLLLMLALVSVPMIFAILGGFIFSAVGGNLSVQYPQFVAWSIGSMESAMWVSLASTLVLAPVILLGFSVLVRQVSRKASLFFLASNLLLLLPFRQPELVALVATIAAIGLMYFYQVTKVKALALKTLEGKVAFAIQFLPIFILLTRSFWLYQFDTVLLSCASLIGFVGIRFVTKAIPEKAWQRVGLEVFSITLAVTTGITFAVTLAEFNLLGELVIGLGTLLISAMTYELSMRGEARAEIYRVIAAVILVAGLLFNYGLFDNLLSSLILLVMGAALLVMSFVYQQKGLLFAGLVLLSTGLYYQIAQLIFGFEFNYWIALAAIGISLIISGSYLEANAGKIKNWLANNKNKIGEWQF
jgi:hypothetical protein